MKKSRFSEEQITRILAENNAGLSTAEICRKHGVSSNTFYKWKSKYGGMGGSEVRRMKEMEAQITRLQKIVAKQAVELEACEEIIKGKW